MRREEGQIIPLLVIVMLAVVALGMLFFSVGRAAVSSTQAQTAADAAALAAAKNVQAQLEAQYTSTGTTDLALVDSSAVLGAASSYASRNDARVVRIHRRGVDVKVWVSTADTTDGKPGLAQARARVQTLVIPQPAAGPPPVGNGDPLISAKEWDKLGSQISSPPTCGSSASTNDLVTLGKLLAAHGFEVGENAEMGDAPAPGVHDAGGWHYKCRDSGALDVNHDQGDEASDIDALVEPLHKLGFRTIWRAAGHFDHIHIDVANSPAIGAGFSDGGAAGPLEETTLDVQLIDWNAAYLEFGGFGGLGGGGSFSGPPDPAVAHTICSVLDSYNADAKVRLAAFEAAIVESGVHNLNYGDRDSLGVYQQRPSVGAWGTAAQILNPQHAAMMFITVAESKEGGQSAGQLAQDVQVSAYPGRYDAVALQATAMLDQFCGGGG